MKVLNYNRIQVCQGILHLLNFFPTAPFSLSLLLFKSSGFYQKQVPYFIGIIYLGLDVIHSLFTWILLNLNHLQQGYVCQSLHEHN